MATAGLCSGVDSSWGESIRPPFLPLGVHVLPLSKGWSAPSRRSSLTDNSAGRRATESSLPLGCDGVPPGSLSFSREGRARRWWNDLANPVVGSGAGGHLGVVKEGPFPLISSFDVAAHLGWVGVGVLNARAATLVVVAAVIMGGSCLGCGLAAMAVRAA